MIASKSCGISIGFNGGTLAPPVLPTGTVSTKDFTPPNSNLVICPKTSLVLFILIGTIDFVLIAVTGGYLNPIDSIKTFINNRFGWETIIGDPTHFDLGTFILILSSGVMYSVLFKKLDSSFNNIENISLLLKLLNCSFSFGIKLESAISYNCQKSLGIKPTNFDLL